MTTVDEALAQLDAIGNADEAVAMAAYHKAERRYLGVRVPQVDALVQDWRANADIDGRITLAQGLWASNIHEARVAAAKLLSQARIRPDAAVWRCIADWVPDFDGWAIADHAAIAGQKRLLADPSRLDEVEGWTMAEDKWTRRAALVFALGWTKQNFPKPDELAARNRVLGWCAGYVSDHDWFIQKAVAWWLRDLSKHDAGQVRAFLAEHAPAMKPWAVKEAGRHLSD